MSDYISPEKLSTSVYGDNVGVENHVIEADETAQSVGGVAIAELREESALEKALPTFLDPEIRLSVKDQLEVMDNFWEQLDVGLRPPNLTRRQSLILAANQNVHNPSFRVVPTPLKLYPYDDRVNFVDAARTAFSKNELVPEAPGIWASKWIDGRLIQDPLGSVLTNTRGATYATMVLGYKTDDGRIVRRDRYLAHLRSTGQAVTGEGGTLWTYPIVDVSVHEEDHFWFEEWQPVDELFDRVDPIMSPEALIVIHLLHQANGTPQRQMKVRQIDFANEAVYRGRVLKNSSGTHQYFKERDGKVYPYHVTGINLLPNFRTIAVGRWNATGALGEPGLSVRKAQNGLAYPLV